MTRKEAVTVLRNAAWLGSDADRERTEEAVEMAVEALGKDTDDPTTDPISRAAAIDAIDEMFSHEVYEEIDTVWNRAIEVASNKIKYDLPSAQPVTITPESSAVRLQDSNDTISRQAAIDTMCDACANWCDEGVCKKTSAIQSLPAAQPAPQWIPCSERMPENNGRYLVTRGLNAAGNLWNRVYIINYSDLMGLRKEKIFWQGDVGKSDFEVISDVIAWMPLPEPWEGDGE